MGHLFGVSKATTVEAILEECGTLQNVVGHTMFWVYNLLAVVVGFLAQSALGP